MPCWNVITNTVDLGVANRDILDATLKDLKLDLTAMGVYLVDGQLKSRRLSVQELEALRSRIKVGVSKRIVGMAAQRMGWQVKAGERPNAYVMERR